MHKLSNLVLLNLRHSIKKIRKARITAHVEQWVLNRVINKIRNQIQPYLNASGTS